MKIQNKKPEISIIIVNYNKAKLARQKNYKKN